MKKLLFSKKIAFFIVLLSISLIFTAYSFAAGEPGDIIWEKTFGGK